MLSGVLAGLIVGALVTMIHLTMVTPIILEAGRGFFKAAGGGYDANAIVGKLGDPWSFAFPIPRASSRASM